LLCGSLKFVLAEKVVRARRNRKTGAALGAVMSKPKTIKAGKSKLVFVDGAQPGITRRKMRRGWGYFDSEGERIDDREEIDRLNAIALPPAYTECWFCPNPDGHLLATGIDARGRKQYRYHPDFRSHRESEKFDGCAQFGALLPRVRKRVKAALRSPTLGRDRAIAAVVRLLDTGSIRIGNASYARQNRSFGATTLLRRHARAEGRALKLKFKAKSGKTREMEVSDPSLIRFVRRMQDLPGQHLFQYLDEEGDAHPVGSAEVNDWLRETMGEDFTAKHFRTWHASVLAFTTLAEAEGQVTLKELLAEVSEQLGNTPAIARKSYVHPAVLALVPGQAKWRTGLRLPRATTWLSRHERGLLNLLEGAPSAKRLLAA
jgi:DNA topoisomerase I